VSRERPSLLTKPLGGPSEKLEDSECGDLSRIPAFGPCPKRRSPMGGCVRRDYGVGVLSVKVMPGWSAALRAE
jgi:hypothetical protein